MSDAYEVQIADAVVSELNDAARAWSLGFEAARDWLPVYERDDLKELRVTVVPPTLDQERLARRPVDQMEYEIVIDFQQRKDPGDRAALDALAYLAEQVHDFYRDAHRLATMASWKVMQAKRPNIYDIGRLYTEHTWETFIELTIRGYR